MTKLTIVICCVAVAPAFIVVNGFGQQDTEDKISRMRSEMADLEASLLAVPVDIPEKYVDFLKLPETGVVKLLPRGFRNDVMRSRMEGGAYYSFVRRSHEYGQGNDIELDEQRLFRVGFAGADYGFFVTLGEGSD